MSQKSDDGGKKGQFVVDLLDEDDGLDFDSEDEFESSEDQQIMEELIRKDLEREEKLSEKAAAWKAAFPASGGILSSKRRFKVPIKMPIKPKENGLLLGWR